MRLSRVKILSKDDIETIYAAALHVLGSVGVQYMYKPTLTLLKENGCEFPSNVRPKVWENFTQDNMENAFEKISKELRAIGLI